MSKQPEGLKGQPNLEEIRKSLPKNPASFEERLDKAEEARLLTLEQILATEKPSQKAYIEELDFAIPYQELTLADLPTVFKLQKVLLNPQSPDEMKLDAIIDLLMKTWGRVDTTVTVENLKKLGLGKALKIVRAIPGLVEGRPLPAKKE